MAKRKISREELQKSHLKSLIVMMIATQIALFKFEMTLLSDEKDIQACKKLIQEGKKAEDRVYKVQHIEILTSIFNTFFAKKEIYFIALVKSINKNVTRWDTTKKGFKEFLALEDDAINKSKEEEQERIKTQEIIAKAKAEGKKVEMTLVNGKVVPIVVEEKKD